MAAIALDCSKFGAYTFITSSYIQTAVWFILCRASQQHAGVLITFTYVCMYLKGLGGNPGNSLVHCLVFPCPPLAAVVPRSRTSFGFSPVTKLGPYHSQYYQSCGLLILSRYGVCSRNVEELSNFNSLN